MPAASTRLGNERAGRADSHLIQVLRASAVLPVLVGFLFFLGLALRMGEVDGFTYYRAIGVGTLTGPAPSLLLPGLDRQPGAGFDGQFYFYIAQDPFLRHPYTARALDNSLRYRRILYPFLAWLLSLGVPARLPYVLVGINVAGCTATVAAVAVAARRAGRSAWLALIVAVFPGLWLALLHDMTEPLQLALASWGLLLESAGLLLLSAFAKEITAVVQVVEFIRNLVAGQRAAALRNLAGAAVYGAWTIGVLLFVRAYQNTVAPGDFASPLHGFVAAILAARSPALYFFLFPQLAICVLGLLRVGWVRDRYALGAGAVAVVGLLAGASTWEDPLPEYRTLALVGILAFMSWLQARDRLGAAIVLLMLFAGILAIGTALVI